MSLKISKLDIQLPLDLVRTCASLTDAHLCKFVATNTEGEFQHSIEVKHNKDSVISLELSNLEIGYEEGRFLAQIKQVFKVFQGPQEESDPGGGAEKRSSASLGGPEDSSDSDLDSNASNPAKKRRRRKKRRSSKDSESKDTGDIIEIKDEPGDFEECAKPNINQPVPTGVFQGSAGSFGNQITSPFITNIYSLDHPNSQNNSMVHQSSPSQNRQFNPQWQSPSQDSSGQGDDSQFPGTSGMTPGSAQKNKNFHCSLCDKSYMNKRNLMVHFNAVHAEEKKYVCRCGERFKWHPYLQKHRRSCQVDSSIPNSQNELSKGSINVASSDSHKMADKKVEIEEESLTEADENPTSVDSNSAEVPYDLQSFI